MMLQTTPFNCNFFGNMWTWQLALFLLLLLLFHFQLPRSRSLCSGYALIGIGFAPVVESPSFIRSFRFTYLMKTM